MFPAKLKMVSFHSLRLDPRDAYDCRWTGSAAGETGTGKELAAHARHQFWVRAAAGAS